MRLEKFNFNTMVLVITNDNFEELVLKSDKPVVVDFWAEWCGPCRAIAPCITEIAAEYEGKALVGKVNIEQDPEITQMYSIRNIPTILFFKNGELVDKQVGLISKATLAGKLDALL